MINADLGTTAINPAAVANIRIKQTFGDPTFWPEMSPSFDRMYKIIKETNFVLNPGQHKTIKIRAPDGRWTGQDFVDNNCKAFKTIIPFVRVAGEFLLETSTSKAGLAAANLHWEMKMSGCVLNLPVATPVTIGNLTFSGASLQQAPTVAYNSIQPSITSVGYAAQ